MFTLIKELGFLIVVRREGPPFLAAFALAELLFKFKSFALECVAFLGVWFVLSLLYTKLFLGRPVTSGLQSRNDLGA